MKRILLLFIVLLMPLSFAWSGETHRQICTAAGISSTEGCVYPDKRGDFSNHICHEDLCIAEKKAEQHLLMGRNFFIDNKISEADFHFGIACHYLSDSIQPYHTTKSDSTMHQWFEKIDINVTITNETISFDDAVSEARNALKKIKKDDNAAKTAEKFAGIAARVCKDKIDEEKAKKERAAVPDCSTIQKTRKNCDLWDVLIEGRFTNPIYRTSKAGNDYTTFYLSQGFDKIKVFSFGTIKMEEGSNVIVDGTYFLNKKTGEYEFGEELDALTVERGSEFPSYVIYLAIIFILIILVFYFALRKK